ncbi:hypothetical protein OC835_005151 [Tilletia horrida]|nr:hypothetical protein OC835_005151 [Tilletia horrida]
MDPAEPQQPPSDFAQGVGSSSIAGSPTAHRAPRTPKQTRRPAPAPASSDLDEDEFDALLQDQVSSSTPSQNGGSTTAQDQAQAGALTSRRAASLRSSPAGVSKDRRRRSGKMTEGQVIKLLRFLSKEDLSIAAVLSSFFSNGPPPPVPKSFVRSAPGDSPHSSRATRVSVHPRFLHLRIEEWLRGLGPETVARRWKKISTFAIHHVAGLVKREIRDAIKHDQLKGPSVSKMNVRTLADYSPAEAAAVAAKVCPTLQKVLDTAVGIETTEEDEKTQVDKPVRPRKKQKRKHMPLPLDLLDSSEDESRELVPVQKERWGYRGHRGKQNVASALLLMALFGRSSKCNLFQQVMAITLDAARIPKRPLELLSRAGACVSVDSVHLMATSLAEDTMRISREVLQRPETVVSLSIDNLNWVAGKRDKSATNRNNMQAAVAGTFYVIDDQTQIAEGAARHSSQLFRAIFGVDMTPPTSTASPVSPLGSDGRPIAMSRQLRDQARADFLNGQLDPYDFIIDSFDQQHFIDCFVAHALRYWIELHSECTALAEKLPSPPQIFPIVPKRSQMLPLPVYDEDEGSIMGNIKVINHIVKDFELNDEWLQQHIVPAVGDAFTATLQRKAIERREDDRSIHPDRDRLDFLQPWAAFFHLKFAFQKYFLDAHAGTAMEMDLLSIRRLASRAGFRNLTTGTVDFHDVDAFMHLYFAAMSEVLISSALRRRGHGDTVQDDAAADTTLVEVGEQEVQDQEVDETRVEQDEQDEQDGELPQGGEKAPLREETMAMPSGGKKRTQHPADEFAKLEWDDLHAAATETITAMLTGDVITAAGAMDAEHPDQILGHSVALFRDLGVYIELRHAVKHGDPGRVMAMLRQALPRFQAGGHHRYVVECLEMLMSVRFELPPALKQVMLAATLVNHAGLPDSFLAADLDIEHMVHDLKHVFPVQGKAGGFDRQRRIGELLPLLRGCKAQLFRAFSISSLDTKHAQRDRSLTCGLLGADLEAYAVFEQQDKGRQSPVFEFQVGDKRAEGTGSKKGKQAKHITTDAVISGLTGLIGSSSKPGAIEAYFARKRASNVAGIPTTELADAEAGELDFTLVLDVERDMGGFMQLDLDVE